MQSPREVLRSCLHNLAETGAQVHSEDIVSRAIEADPDLMATYGDTLIRQALTNELRKIMRDVAGSDDLNEQGEQLHLEGIGEIPAYLTIVSPDDSKDRYIRRTLSCTGAELWAAVTTREVNIGRATRAKDRLSALADKVGPSQTVEAFLRSIEDAA